MSEWRARLVLLLLLAGFTWGMLNLFGVQFSIGDVYPEYSSLRSDPVGSRLLFESLSRLPGITIERNYLPLGYFPGDSATVLLLGTRLALLHESEFVRLVERVAGRGHRVVIALGELPVYSSGQAFPWDVRLDSKRAYFAQAKDWKALEGPPDKPVVIERGFGKGTVVLSIDSDPFANGSAMKFKRLESVADCVA